MILSFHGKACMHYWNNGILDGLVCIGGYYKYKEYFGKDLPTEREFSR